MKKFLKLPKKILIPVLIVILLLGYFLLRPKNNTPKLQFAAVKRQDIRSTVSSSGTLTGKDSVNLKFKSAGKLAYLNVKTGDSVEAFQTIAGLDTQQLSIDLQQAQNTLRDKQATVDKILDDVKNHSTDESFTQKQTRTTAEAARDSAVDSVKEAQRAFQDDVLISPISGLITQADPVPGQNVSASDVIAQVVDNSEVFFDSDIDEADIGKITLGKSAEVTLDAYGDKIFKGTVARIKPQTKTTSSNATVVTVRVKLSDNPINFVNGLTGQATIILEEAKNALTIPQEALRDDNVVFVGAKERKVVPGIKSDTDVEIKEGLGEDDRVLLNPPAVGTRVNQNRNPLQGIIFRVFGGGRGFGSPRR